jgi:putative transposase
MDNGREFHAEAVTDALLNLAIITEYAASRDPNDKAHVERFLKTFNYSFIHKLPGTTLAKVHQRIGFRAEDEACLTLEELDRMIHAWILGVYHLRRHAGLGGRAPIDVWNESAKAFPPQLKASVDDIDIEFGEVNESTPQQYGIDLNNFRYASDRLTVLFGTLPKKTKVHVKWPRHDVGCIWIWDPLEKEYFKATNTDASYDGLTVEQAKAVKKQYEDNPEYKRTRAEAKEMIRATEADAMGDKQLKNRRKGARLANKTSKEFHRDEPQFNEMPSKANPPPAQEETKVEEFEIDGFDVGGGH